MSREKPETYSLSVLAFCSKEDCLVYKADEIDAYYTSQMKDVLERVLPEEKILQIFYDHYWDSLEKDKGIIDKHCEYLAKIIRKVIDEELERIKVEK